MKKIKMCIYGSPGVGKSTFASKAPNPLFICSDGNFEWLDLPKENGITLQSWAEFKQTINNEELLSKYDTIVVDLLEDFFKLCEYEFCQKNRISHISDLGYGKAYDITRNEFFIEISKLLTRDKNIILIMHGLDTVKKDRRGVEYMVHIPSNRLPDKVLDMIEGRVRYFLRCYLKAEEVKINDTNETMLVKKRYLSLIPKENEYGICRGIDENKVPQDIPLDYDEFYKLVTGNEISNKITSKPVETSESKTEEIIETKPKAEETSESEDKITALKRKMEALKNKEK